ncbi:MAG: murein biosynthesis integral membrane protein MurJ [Acidobacteriota bacterium]
MTHSLHKKVGIASMIMMGSVFSSRLIALFREMTVAYIGGAKTPVDAYQAAFVFPEILNHIAASGFLSVTFIPIFAGYLARNLEEDGWRIFNTILNTFGILLLGLVAFGMIFTPELIHIAAPGRWEDQEFRNLAIRMTRIIIPAQIFFFAGGLFMAVQFAKEKFLIPALAPLVYNLGIIGGGRFLGPYIGMEGFSWGVLAGAFLGNFLLQAWGAHRVGMTYRFNLNLRDPDLTRYIRLTLPLMVGLTMMFSIEIFIRFFGSYLPEGNISALNYSRTILTIPVGLFGQAVGMASFPFMAQLAADHRIQEMNHLMNKALRYLSMVIPFSIVLIVVRHELVQILFERGQFDASATALTAPILAFLLPGAFALSAYTVVVRGYYAMQNTLFPAVFGSIAVLCSLPAYIYGMRQLGGQGVALAVSLSIIFQVVLLYILWNRKTDNSESSGVYHLYLKVILIGIPIGALAEWIRRSWLSGTGTGGDLQALWICCIVGAGYCLLFIALGYLLKVEEIKPLLQRFTGLLQKSS